MQDGILVDLFDIAGASGHGCIVIVFSVPAKLRSVFMRIASQVFTDDTLSLFRKLADKYRGVRDSQLSCFYQVSPPFHSYMVFHYIQTCALADARNAVCYHTCIFPVSLS